MSDVWRIRIDTYEKKKNYFFWRPEDNWRKEHDPDPTVPQNVTDPEHCLWHWYLPFIFIYSTVLYGTGTNTVFPL